MSDFRMASTGTLMLAIRSLVVGTFVSTALMAQATPRRGLTTSPPSECKGVETKVGRDSTVVLQGVRVSSGRPLSLCAEGIPVTRLDRALTSAGQQYLALRGDRRSFAASNLPKSSPPRALGFFFENRN